jgi:acyl-CoA reductase-like NAD-dependent aldehyde dehydrogenase
MANAAVPVRGYWSSRKCLPTSSPSAEQAKKIKLGPGLDEATQMGPLVSEEQLRRVTRYMNQGKREGACYVTGGQRAATAAILFNPP